MIDSTWNEKLIPLVERDMLIREGLVRRGILSDAYHKEMEKVHLENAHKLQKLIDSRGFPVLSNAGEDAVRKAWLIIHNAISWPDFMKEGLLQMKFAASHQDFPMELIAYTEDRIRFFEGRPQLYGTNLDWQDGELKPTPIEAPDEANLRRRAMGIPPLESFTKNTFDKPPKDPESKAQEFKKWLSRVGWRP
jgi:hypothetical protein